MCKAICGVAAGACNGAINLHWAKGSDISDINAKFGAQHTVTGGLGLLFAALFARSVSTVPTFALWSLYASLTFLHVFANLRCVRLIAFNYMNTERMELIVKEFLTKIDDIDQNKLDNNQTVAMDDPSSISKRESLFFKPYIPSKWRSMSIRMGSSFDSVRSSLAVQSNSTLSTTMFVEQMILENYAIVCGSKEILVVISPDVDPMVKAKAYFNACLMRHMIVESKLNKQDFLSSKAALLEICEQTGRLWPIFVRSASKVGWDLNKTELSTDGFCVAIEENTH